MSKIRLASILAGTSLALAVPLLAPSEAKACGGTMCDQGPMAMPVDQTGENVLFVYNDDHVEAHIQIQYNPETDAEKFAWVIPVTALPTFEVGSDILFTNMLNGSVPRYANAQQQDFCGDGGDDGLSSGGDEGAGGETGNGDGDTGEEPPDENPNVVHQENVGAFEITVLEGGTVEGVMSWLGENGYEQDPDAEPILAQYLEEGHLFVAMKLNTSIGVGVVHPIVLRIPGQEACVPIRLTRIAAEEDMDIRVFFLDGARVVPVNYRHVLVNPLKIDWFNQAANYKEVITMAVDADAANGNAFVTEYAGDSNVISPAGLFDSTWDPNEFAILADNPTGIVEILENMNLITCNADWDAVCTTFHPLLDSLLAQYVPVPDDVDPVVFYDCMECYPDLVDIEAWDATLFAEAFNERLVKPGENAMNLLANNSYLTRMYTTISPGEMNADPIFRVNDTLPEVAALRQSTQTLHCDGSTTVELPDGREITFPPGPLTWPDFQDEMPWAEDIDEENMAENTPLISLVDNTEMIDQLLADWNDEQDNQSNDSETGDAGSNGEGASCACTATEDDPKGGLAFGLALLGLAGLVRRRKQ